MAKRADELLAVKDAVYRLQNYLLEGVSNESQLFAAGSIMSRGDYEDVVTERTIVNLCGYPLCSNSLPSDRPRKGRYRISLKEHKVYDLREAYMYCSSGCLVNSRIFAEVLQEERCSVLNPVKLHDVLRLFDGLSLELKESGDFGISKLKIQEKGEVKSGEVSTEQWAGPWNAIEGYVPQKQRDKPRNVKPDNTNLIINGFDFVSCIITEDEYSVSKLPPSSTKMASDSNFKESKGESVVVSCDQPTWAHKINNKKSNQSKRESKFTYSVDDPSSSNQDGSVKRVTEPGDISNAGIIDGKLGENGLKSKGANKVHSVTWADENEMNSRNGKLCDVREIEDAKGSEILGDVCFSDEDTLLRFSSAEACAMALNQAAEAIASGNSDVSDAVSDAGLIILPPSHGVEEEVSLEDPKTVEIDIDTVKWPRKPGVPTYDLFDSDDSWFDAPPEGFSLTLSPFATMWSGLFSWVTSSSLAYIYGQDDSFQEDYTSVNGREYPQKIVLADGRSSEIKQTLAGCLARALPGLVTDLRLPIPISTLEKGLGRLLDTMTFVDPLPSFQTKQWQVVLVLFIEALSIFRIPALTPHMTNKRALLHKVLDGAHMGVDEFEIMKDLLIPLRGELPASQRSGA
ncbi:hypothetical protein SAY86_006010 [Trapa natans]|uniref:RNA polymerase II subunit B1 CTD phosphatase RPAP2 homolog n=1 Tax=Trapa natans TaxID=22666 RepID=A0AAN7L2X9_TRANT|nr:hypothetical protein SAY86_006010 [Trapa natans]